MKTGIRLSGNQDEGFRVSGHQVDQSNRDNLPDNLKPDIHFLIPKS